MTIETKNAKHGWAVVYLSGDFEPLGLKRFKSEIRKLVASGCQQIIVDCRELNSMSSRILSALLWARSVGGTIYLTHVSSVISQVLRITSLGRLLHIEPTTRGLLRKQGVIRKARPISQAVGY